MSADKHHYFGQALGLLTLLAAGAVAGRAQVTITPSPVAFGNVGLGLTTSVSITITNNGSSSVSVESLTFSDPVHFGLIDGAIPVIISPGTHPLCSWVFAPTAAVNYTATVTLTMSGAPNVTVNLTGTGESVNATPVLSTMAINFGTVALGTTASQSVTVTNTGTSSININTIKYYEPYNVGGYSGGTVTLGGGQSFTFTVSFCPVNLGAITGNVTIDFNLVPSVAIALTGTGGSPPGLAIVNYPILPAATPGYVYQTNLTATGGTPPYTWSASGQSVSGLALNPTTGLYSGSLPSNVAAGTYTPTFTVTDASTPVPLVATQAATLAVEAATGANCAIDSIDVPGTNTPTVALTDLGAGTYQGYQGGLYPSGSNVDPTPHDSDAMSIAQGIQPRDANGNIDPENGLIVLLSIGQSTTQQPYVDFKDISSVDPAKNPRVVAVQGAMGSETANKLIETNSPYLATIVNYYLPFQGVTPAQVAVAWVNAEDSLTSSFPTDATVLQGELESLAQILYSTFPNMELSYWGSLNYTGYSLNVDTVDPEPQGYESAYAIKWAIQDQIDGNANLNYNPNNGPVLAPWMGWGPYYWANGLIASQNGTYWDCQDMNSDGLHPGAIGHYKIVDNLLNYFKTTGSTSAWFDAAPAANLNPSSLTFASQNVGTSSPAQSVTLTATTNSVSISSIAISGANAGDFSQTNTCGSNLGPGANCTVNVAFTPTAAGTRTASVTITDNATGSPQTVSLTGTAVGVPVVSLSPTSLTFATQLIYSSSPTQNVTLTNTGSATLSVTSIAITGANTTSFSETNACGTTLSAGASCTISVTFAPKAKGTLTACVSITDNATGSPQTIALTGTGTIVSLSPASLTFGTQTVGTSSAPQTITLTNKSTNNTVNITKISITGTNTGDFSETNNCPATVAAGGSCTITVTFKPRATGTRSASVTVSDNGGGLSQSVSLSGTGGKAFEITSGVAQDGPRER